MRREAGAFILQAVDIEKQLDLVVGWRIGVVIESRSSGHKRR
jgi:hypothetical protein